MAMTTAAGQNDLIFVPGLGVRSAGALGTRANVVVEQGGRTLVAAITPDRDGVRLEFTISGIEMDLGFGPRPFDGPVRIRDDARRDIGTPRPRWQVGGQLRPAAGGTATLRYVTLLEPLASGVRHVELEVDGVVGEWRVRIPVAPADLVGLPARPIDVSDAKNGLTIAARTVARSSEQTAIELEAYFDPPAFDPDDPGPARRWVRGLGCSGMGGRLGGDGALVMRDETGGEHPERGRSLIEPFARKHREVLLFPGLAPEARTASLEIPSVWITERTDDAVTLDVPSESDISMAGCDAHAVVSRVGDRSGPRVRIQLDPADPTADRQLLYLENVDTGTGPMGTVGTGITHCAGQRPFVEAPDPSGQLAEITLRGPVIDLRGPWRLQIPLG